MNVNTRFVYDFLADETSMRLSEPYLSEEECGMKEYFDCYGLPHKRKYESRGYAVDAGGLEVNGEIIENTSLSGWSMGYEFDKNDSVHCVEKCVFLGYLCDNIWGHAITDSMTHLWWFHTEEYKNRYSDLKIFYWSEKPIKGPFLDLYKLAGVPIDKLYYLDKVTHFDDVVVPGDCFFRSSAKDKLLFLWNM